MIEPLPFESWILTIAVNGLAARIATLEGHSICRADIENQPYGIHDACQSCVAWLNECKQCRVPTVLSFEASCTPYSANITND